MSVWLSRDEQEGDRRKGLGAYQARDGCLFALPPAENLYNIDPSGSWDGYTCVATPTSGIFPISKMLALVWVGF